jgi:hypothetical protein
MRETSVKFSFSSEQEEFRSNLRRLLADRSPTKEVRRLMETDYGYEREGWRAINTALGLTAIRLPEAYSPLSGEATTTGARPRDARKVIGKSRSSLASGAAGRTTPEKLNTSVSSTWTKTSAVTLPGAELKSAQCACAIRQYRAISSRKPRPLGTPYS